MDHQSRVWEGQTYFAAFAGRFGLVKIGFTMKGNYNDRLNEIAAGAGKATCLLALPYNAEREYHARFASLRAKEDPDDTHWLNKVPDGHPLRTIGLEIANGRNTPIENWKEYLNVKPARRRRNA
jgi:hypothetical protein